MMLLVGCGQMAVEHANVLNKLMIQFKVVGRSNVSATDFENQTGFPVIRGGLNEAIEMGVLGQIDSAIVVVGVENLFDVTFQLIKYGVKRILVEKPAGVDANEVFKLRDISKSSDVKIFVAYNRRFYSSVSHALRLIEEDGGVSSFTFDFTEWSDEIEFLEKKPGVKENWLLANSSHVIDLAFFMCGQPEKIIAIQDGFLEWHKGSSKFAGIGAVNTGAIFSYHSNWDSPGRWGLEICTKNMRIILRPLEQLRLI